MRETMRIDGGIKLYALHSKVERHLTNEKPYGRKVKFLNKNGYDYQRERANQLFNEGDILTVKEIYVDRSSSEVEFVEVPNERFNTVMFGDVE